MRTVLTTISTIILALFASGPQAQTLQPWGNAGGWQIMVDPTLGNACLIRKIFPDSTEVRIGRDSNAGKGYVLVYDRDWGNLTVGETYKVSFDLDGQRYDTTARGLEMQGVPGGGIYFGDNDFFNKLAKKYVMTIYGPKGNLVTRISLDGTYVALTEARKCQRRH